MAAKNLLSTSRPAGSRPKAGRAPDQRQESSDRGTIGAIRREVRSWQIQAQDWSGLQTDSWIYGANKATPDWRAALRMALSRLASGRPSRRARSR